MIRKMLLGAVIVAAAPSAWACPSCLCGDPTLTLMGVEKSYAGRTRFSFDYTNRSEIQGEGVDRSRLQEDRYVFGASYAFTPDINVALRLPFSSKSAERATLAKDEAKGLGDAEILAKVTVFKTGGVSGRHLFGVQAGLRLPTSSEQTDSTDAPIDIDAQPGTGAWAPSLGVWYGYFQFPASVFVTVTVTDPVSQGYQGIDQATALLTTVTSQYAVTKNWSLQLGLESRIAGHNEFYGVEDGDSGGVTVFAAPGVVLSLGENWLLHASGQIPVLQHQHGVQDERGDLRIGIAYDLPR